MTQWQTGYCNVVIYNKISIYSSPVPFLLFCPKLLRFWNLQRDWCLLYANEWPLAGASCSCNQVILGLELFLLTSREGRGLKVELITNG
jgi:hypothetical protein